MNNSAMSNGVFTFIRILFANLETINVRRLFLNWWCRCFQSPHLLLHSLQLLLQHGDLRVFVGGRLCRQRHVYATHTLPVRAPHIPHHQLEIISRTSRRKSSANGAFESANVWF